MSGPSQVSGSSSFSSLLGVIVDILFSFGGGGGRGRGAVASLAGGGGRGAFEGGEGGLAILSDEPRVLGFLERYGGMPSFNAVSRDGVTTGIWLWKAIDKMRRFSASVVSLSSSFMPSCSSATPSSLISPWSLNRATTSGARSVSEMA